MRLYISFDQCFLHDFMIVIFIDLSISCSIFSPIFEGGLEILGLTPSVFYSLSCAEIAASIRPLYGCTVYAIIQLFA